jgi:hypothetical protein
MAGHSRLHAFCMRNAGGATGHDNALIFGSLTTVPSRIRYSRMGMPRLSG